MTVAVTELVAIRELQVAVSSFSEALACQNCGKVRLIASASIKLPLVALMVNYVNIIKCYIKFSSKKTPLYQQYSHLGKFLSSLLIMGTRSSLMLQDDEIKQISLETGFTPPQIEKLYSRFAHLDRNNCGTLTKSDLMSIPELAINPLCDRLIQIFFADCEPENERINFKQFVNVLATFRATNNNWRGPADADQTHNSQCDTSMGRKVLTETNHPNSRRASRSSHDNKQTKNADQVLVGINDNLKKKLMFLFKIYDADNDGKISFHDLKSILKMMVGHYIEDMQLDKIATRAFVEVDEDNDGYIDLSEFYKVFNGKDMDDKLRVKFFH